MTQEELAALTAFVVDHPELDRLEAMLAEFNIFEAAGLTREEIRHSKFLAFLLDPKEAHGLGDLFLTKVLQAVVADQDPESLPASALELELMDLSDAQVMTEHLSIDLLMLSPANEFAVVIENKIGTGEHSEQLSRYLKAVQGANPGWRLLPVLLSPSGIKPSHANYFSLSYGAVADILGSLLQSRGSALGSDVFLALSHYERLLRRHVVSDSKLNELCQQIIRKHRKALELLFEQWEDPRSRAKAIGEQLFEEAGFERDGTQWIPTKWREWVPTCDDTSWSPTGLMLRCWINMTKAVWLTVEIGPGPQNIREAMFKASVEAGPPFLTEKRTLKERYSRIVRYQLAASVEPKDGDYEAYEEAMRARFLKFVAEDMPKIERALRTGLDGIPM